VTLLTNTDVSSLAQPINGVWIQGVALLDNFNLLMTLIKIKFFWLPLSTMKCSKVPFTHICEWKRYAGASSVSTRGRTTQRLGIISESQTLAVTANLLELIEKWKKIKCLEAE
jgi:hypothetical protein